MASYEQRLVKEFGTTGDPGSGGFLLPDGEFLDLSGGTGYRTDDHRIINFVLPRGAERKYDSRYDVMVHICKKIRMYRWMPESWYLETWTAPTRGPVKHDRRAGRL